MTTHYTFGKLLRKHRLGARDIEEQNRQLTQERLAELCSREEKVGKVSHTSISQWETSSRGAPGRSVLLGLIKVLHTCGGITAVDEANDLLRAAYVRELHLEEVRRLGFTITSDVEDEKMKDDKMTRVSTNVNVGTNHGLVTGRIKGTVNLDRSNALDKYMRGVERLHFQLKAKDRQAYLSALPLLGELTENIERAKRGDESAEISRERRVVIGKLDQLCMNSLDDSFQALCY